MVLKQSRAHLVLPDDSLTTLDGRQPLIVDNLKNEDDLKIEDNLKNENSSIYIQRTQKFSQPQCANNLNNGEDPKIKATPNMTVLKIKIT